MKNLKFNQVIRTTNLILNNKKPFVTVNFFGDGNLIKDKSYTIKIPKNLPPKLIDNSLQISISGVPFIDNEIKLMSKDDCPLYY